MTIKKVFAGIGFAILMGTAMGLSIVIPARVMPIEKPAPAPTVLHCPYGNAEDSCDFDYVGNGNWTLIKGADQ